MKDCASGRMNVMAALLAGKRMAGSHKVVGRDFATVLAGYPVGVAVFFEPFETSRIVWELLLKVKDCVLFHVGYLSLPTLMVSHYVPTVRG